MIASLLLASQVAAPAPASDATLRFAPPITVPTGANTMATGIATGDLDGDGLLEILTANSFGASMTVLHNLGGGSFLATQRTAGNGEVRDVAVGEVTGDGVLDVVVSMRGAPATLVVFDGLGDGSLAPPRAFGPSMQFSADVELADFDRDGDLDAVVAMALAFADPAASVFLNDGSGNFDAPATYTFVSNVPFTYGTTLAVGDVDGDGILDLVGSGQPNVEVVGLLIGRGDGTFEPAVSLDVGAQLPMSLVLRDVDQDGDLDLGVHDAPFAGPRVILARNDGSGAFLQPEVVPTGGSSGFEEARRALEFADFNGSGALEFVAANTFAANTPTGLQPVLPAAFGFDAEVVDIDRDGRLDALIATRDGSFNGLVVIHLNRTRGSLTHVERRHAEPIRLSGVAQREIR